MQRKFKLKLNYLLLIIIVFLSSCDFTSAEQNFVNANEYADDKDYKNAISELDKAIRKKHKYRRALFNRAIYKTEIKNISGAVDDYKKILNFTNCTECAYKLAILLNNDKQYKKAIEVLNATLKMKGVIKNRGIIGVITPNLQFYNDDSDSDYNVNEDDIYFERGLAFLNSKQYKKAIIDFEKTNNVSLYKAEGYYNIGEAYLGLKDTIKACENYEQSEKLKYKNATNRIKEVCK